MCGRITQGNHTEELAERFAASEVVAEFPPRFNIAPTQALAVVNFDAEHRVRVLQPMRWGLVPMWAKDPEIGNKLFNARSETLAEKPSFRTAFKRRRCLIPADGYYEWKREGKDKTPFHVHLPGFELFAFAGLWEEWNSPDGSPLRTCTIITVEPNPQMSALHHRMPVILQRHKENAWLSPATSPAEAASLLAPFPDGGLEFHQVSPRVNSARFDDATLIEPFTQPRPPETLSLF